MKKLVLMIPILLLFTIWACDDRDDNLLGPNVRIQNSTNLNFSLVQVRDAADSIFYNNVQSGSFSSYLEYETAFRQDRLLIESDSTLFTFQPDSLSQPLPIGLYTYEITLSESEGVQLHFKID